MTMPVDLASQPVRNLTRRLGGTGQYTANGTTTVVEAVTDPSWPQPVTRVSRTSGFFYARICNSAGTPTFGAIEEVSGKNLTVGVWVLSPANFVRIPRRQSGATTYTTRTVTVTPNVWSFVTTTYQVETAAVSVQLEIGYESSDNGGVAFSFLLRDAMVVIGNTAPADWSADGDTPGWRWTEAAYTSQSVGYPYTLESIAGAPLATVTTGGVDAPLPVLPAMSGRSMYVVYDVAATTADYPALGLAFHTVNNPAVGRLSIQHGASGSTTTQGRIDTTGGTSNATINALGTRTVGRHVGAVTINDGLTLGTVDVDGVTGTRTITPGTGFTSAAPIASMNSTNGAVFMAVYGRFHDTATRRRVMAWLARRYGAPIPAGY